MTSSPEQVSAAVLAFVNAQTWSESKRTVEAHREVRLTDAVDAVLASLLEQHRDD